MAYIGQHLSAINNIVLHNVIFIPDEDARQVRVIANELTIAFRYSSKRFKFICNVHYKEQNSVIHFVQNYGSCG